MHLPGRIDKGAVGIRDRARHIGQNDRKRAFIKEPAHPAFGFGQRMFPFMGGHRIREDHGLTADRTSARRIDRMGDKAPDRFAPGNLEFDLAIDAVTNDKVGQFHGAVIEVFGFTAKPACQTAVEIKNTAFFIKATDPDRQPFDHLIGMFKATSRRRDRKIGNKVGCNRCRKRKCRRASTRWQQHRCIGIRHYRRIDTVNSP